MFAFFANCCLFYKHRVYFDDFFIENAEFKKVQYSSIKMGILAHPNKTCVVQCYSIRWHAYCIAKSGETPRSSIGMGGSGRA